MLLVASLAPLILFRDHLYPDPSYLLGGGALVAFLVLSAAVTRGRQSLENSLKIRFFQVAKTVTPKAITGILIMVSILFYLNYFSWGKFNDTLGRTFITQLLVGAEPAIRLWFPGVSFNQTVGDFLKAIAAREVERVKLPLVTRSETNFQLDVSQLPPAERERLETRVAGELQKSLEAIVGPLDPKESLTDGVYRLIQA
jgi:hypothetical protein